MSEQPHSAEYFGDTRDFWWNRDFLELMSIRWRLSAVRAVLDVGCGVGHWGRCLAPFLSPDCVLTGVDRESRWIEEARNRGAGAGKIATRFHQGEAERLPFPDASFDMVTCQTVLIHVKDPLVVLGEMLRVLAPGGLLAVVEPNNITANLSYIGLQQPAHELVALIGFQMICERGKMNLGEGFNSAGSSVAGWLSALGVKQVESYLSDKTINLLPPYATAHAQAIKRESVDRSQREFWIWNRADTLRYFLAGGGNADAFQTLWSKALASEKDIIGDIERGQFSLTAAPVCFLVSGRKSDAA